MLKFADLRVDMKSLEKALDTFMKLFPNYYMSLLIMYLSREGLLKVESDVEENNPRVLLSITSKEIAEFFEMYKLLQDEVKDDLNYANFLAIDTSEKDWYFKYDFNVLSSCVSMMKRFTAGNSFSLVYGDTLDTDILKIKDIFTSNTTRPKETAALWLFCEILMNSFPAIGEDSYLSDFHYTRLFDSYIKSLQRSNNRFCLQPEELTRIILSQYHVGSVYNPFAGLASYHVEMAHGLREDVSGDGFCYFYNNDDFFELYNSLGENYWGEEIDELTWAVGKLRLMFYHMDSPNYILGDSTQKFKRVVRNLFCTPPFNLQIINEAGEKEYADHFVIRRGLENLTTDGTMAVVVPVSFFSRRDTFDIRKDLISRHLIKCIVYLPENIFPSARISTAIIFVENGLERDYVKFVDATKMVIGESMLNIAAISNMIEHNEYPMDGEVFTFGECNYCDELTPVVFSSSVHFETNGGIADNDYNLSPSNYFSSYIDIPEGFKLERLKNLVYVQGPKNVVSEVEGKVIGNGDFARDFQLPYIDYSALGSKTVNSNYKCLDKKSLVTSSINELRPSIFAPKDSELVYVSPNVLAFYLNDKKVNAEYLIGEMSKDYVKEQIRFMQMGATLRRIRRDDVLSLQILVPDSKDFLRKEKSLADDLKTAYLEKVGLELAELKDKRHDEYVKMLRQRKHRLQQIMNEFAPAFAQLNNCRIKQGGVLHDDDVAAARTGETVGSYFDKLNTIVGKVEDLVTNLVNKDNWGESSDIDIDNFVDKIPQSHLSDKYEIQVYHDRDYEIWEEGEIANLNAPRIVRIDENSLSTLFENIIANALKWGFNEDVRRDYFIRITVSDGVVNNQNAVRIGVANNGTPIHESVDRSRFFEWGYGSGTGIGTSQLKDIVEHYGGSIRLNENHKDSGGFCTEYEILLPIIDFN